MSQELWAHQRDGVERALLNNGCFGFMFEVGTGKTLTAITVCRSLFNKHSRVLTTLIISPLITLQNWKREWLAGSTLKEHQIVVLEGTGAQKARKAFDIREPSVIIINYESLQNEFVLKAIQQCNPDILIVDESHNCKNPSASRTKSVHLLARQIRYRMILSGTPILKSTMDIWAQHYIIDLGKTFGDSFFRFKLCYFYDKNANMPKHKHFPDWQPRPEKKKQLEDLLAERTMSVRKSDCLDLPPLIRQKVFIEIEKEQKKHYLQMKELFVTYINDRACVASLAITKALRMMQILSGHMPLDDGSCKIFEDTPRVKALAELLSDLGPYHKIIVWAVFKEDYKVIANVCKKLSLPYVELHGEVLVKDKFTNVDTFNKDPDCRVLIGNPGSGGVGVNLTASSVSIYYSRNFSLSSDLQSEARNYRAGSEIHKTITRIDIIAKDTMDEHVLEALHTKKEVGLATLKDWCSES